MIWAIFFPFFGNDQNNCLILYSDYQFLVRRRLQPTHDHNHNDSQSKHHTVES